MPSNILKLLHYWKTQRLGHPKEAIWKVIPTPLRALTMVSLDFNINFGNQAIFLLLYPNVPHINFLILSLNHLCIYTYILSFSPTSSNSTLGHWQDRYRCVPREVPWLPCSGAPPKQWGDANPGVDPRDLHAGAELDHDGGEDRVVGDFRERQAVQGRDGDVGGVREGRHGRRNLHDGYLTAIMVKDGGIAPVGSAIAESEAEIVEAKSKAFVNFSSFTPLMWRLSVL
jgi:hypothetical protein